MQSAKRKIFWVFFRKISPKENVDIRGKLEGLEAGNLLERNKENPK